MDIVDYLAIAFLIRLHACGWSDGFSATPIIIDHPRPGTVAAPPSSVFPRVTAFCLRFLSQRGEPQSSSASRLTAGAFGFLTFTQCDERPERYSEPTRLLTIPSQPSLQACWNMMSPSPS